MRVIGGLIIVNRWLQVQALSRCRRPFIIIVESKEGTNTLFGGYNNSNGFFIIKWRDTNSRSFDNEGKLNPVHLVMKENWFPFN